MKKLLSIILSILMVVTMLPIAIMPASAAYDYDETAKISFKITNLVREWKGETEELGEYGSGFYEQSLTKVADGKYKYTYKAALSTGGGTWWSDPKTVTFDGVDCESDYYKTFEFTESTSVGGYTMTWTYTLEIKRSGSYGHLYSAWSDNGDGTHTRTCQINSTHVETLHHDWVAVTCVKAAHCETCGMVNGEPSSNAHNWGAWAPNGDGTHTRVCAWDNEHVEVEDCAYSDATCTALAKCSVCAGTTGDLNDKNHSGTTFTYEENSESLHNKYYACCGAFAKSESHTFNLAGLCTVCSYQCMHASYTDSICDVCKNECPHSDVGDDGVCTDCGKSGLLYIDRQWDAATKTLLKFNRFIPPEADIKVTSSTSSMSNGWYIVEGDVTIPSRITITGTVHLILCDGAVLDAHKGITVSEGNTLCVYAQSDGSDTGKLIATGDGFNAGIGGDNEERNGGTVTINGGIVTATGGAVSIYNGAGIGGSYDGKGCTVTINGGVVTATGGGADGAGIGGGASDIYKNSGCGGDVTINGGVVIAKGGWRAAGIGGGYKGNGGSVVITGGNVYAVDGDNEVNIGHGIGGNNSGSLKDADGNNVYLNTITLSDAADNTAVTELTGATYGLTDVTTLDTNKLYFYLPSGSAATSITAGGVEYICNRNLTYYTEHEYKDATCITPQTCRYCGHTAGEATLSHNYVNGVCTVCGMGEANGVLHIGTPQQFMMFADYVNYVNKDADAVLMADIDLSGYDWDIICETGLYYNGYGDDLGYAGTFDGNGHIIKNISVKSSTTIDASCGLFGTVSGTIKNLGIEGFTFVDGGKDIRTGAIVGQLITTNGRVENCYVKNATIKPGAHVTGGIAGCVYDGTIENCYVVESDINGTSNRYGYIVGDSRGDKGTTDRPGTVKNCYTDNSTIRSNNVGNITDCATKSASAFASGEVTYLLNGKKSDGELVWGQLIGTDSYPVFGGETVYYNETNGYYNILHTCDFTGEWKYDSEKHWKECECGETSEEAEHTYTDSKCDCGYECPHEDTYNNLIRPVQNADGTWGKGKIVKICNTCGNSSLVQEVERDHEGYKVFDETALELEAILNSGKMTDTWKNDYTNILNGLRNSAYYQVYTEIETAIPSMTESLKSIIAAIEAGLADGTMRRADFTYMTALFDEINALIDNDPNKLIPSESGRFQGIYYGYYMSCKNNGNHSQADYDQNMAGNNWEGQIEAILAGVKDGTALKADYTAIDEAIAEIEKKLADENVTDEAKAELEEIKSQLEEKKADGNTSAADLAELEKALEDYETELDAGIEDGSAVKVNGQEIFNEKIQEINDELIEKYGEEIKEFSAALPDEVVAGIEKRTTAIYNEMSSLEGSVKDNEEKLAEFKAELEAIFAELENCFTGTHNGLKFEVTEEAECGKNAVESAVCTLCGETVTREVENSALTHSFTKYEVTEEAKCGIAGKKVASCDNGCGATDEKAIEALKHSFTKYEVTEEAKCGVAGKKVAACDNGCGATDEKAIEALKHLFIDYIYNEDATCTADGTKTAECIYGCGETDTVTAEDTMLDHVDEDGDKICDDCESEIIDVCPDCGLRVHEKTGIPQYICLLITLIKLVVSFVKSLQGAAA